MLTVSPNFTKDLMNRPESLIMNLKEWLPRGN